MGNCNETSCFVYRYGKSAEWLRNREGWTAWRGGKRRTSRGSTRNARRRANGPPCDSTRFGKFILTLVLAMLLTSCFVYSKKKEAIEAEHVAELARRAAEQEEAQKTAALARAKARATDAEWRASIARRRHVKFAEASTKLEVSVFFYLTVCPY